MRALRGVLCSLRDNGRYMLRRAGRVGWEEQRLCRQARPVYVAYGPAGKPLASPSDGPVRVTRSYPYGQYVSSTHKRVIRLDRGAPLVVLQCVRHTA